jgi:hypothetical protein
MNRVQRRLQEKGRKGNGRKRIREARVYSAMLSEFSTAPAFHCYDALCTNQEDTVEKTIQVRCMAEIFAKARCVLTWLGDVSRLPLMSTVTEHYDENLFCLRSPGLN